MMTMAMDNSNRYGAINFENISYPGAPQFNHPWPPSTTSSSASHGVYASTQHNMNHNIPLDVKPLPQHRRLSGNLPLGPYGHVSVSSASSGSPLDAYTSQPSLTSSQDILNNSRSVSTAFDSSYATSHSPATANQQSFSPDSAPYESMGYAPAPVRSTYAIQPHESSRRLSPPSVNAISDDASAKAPRSYRLFPPIDVQDSNHSNENRGYMETMDPNHRMIPISQSTSPRNFYAPPRIRGSGDSYGFQGSATHSNASSLSSPGGYQPYFASAVGSHVGEYVSHGMPGNSSDIDSVASRTLPRPSNLLSTGVPPAPQSMMGQFSSKVSSSTQKKHKCKVCDKRFTRPSSLQTHMYSHTGEKPFSCNVEGCGRQFSVVSNLRRHRKVHKGEARSEAGSEEHQPEE